MIEPALTPDGWAMFAGDPIESAENFIHQTHADEDQEAVNAHMHAVAALALYGQPFGFTREDVLILRGVAENRGWPGFASLADRIEALLPPEA